MQEKEMSRKKNLIGTGILIGGFTIAALLALYFSKESKNTEQPKKNQIPETSKVRGHDYPLIATTYQSIADSNDFIVKFNDEFYKAKPVRAAKRGEGVLAELNREEAWMKYGTALCTAVLRRLYENKILQPGDMLYNLEPIPNIGNGELNTQYKVGPSFGIKHTLFGEPQELTDIVNKK